MKDIFENVIAQAPADWDNDLMSLSDELKDLAVFSWFQAKPSWIEDFLPEALHDLKKPLHLIFGRLVGRGLTHF